MQAKNFLPDLHLEKSRCAKFQYLIKYRIDVRNFSILYNMESDLKKLQLHHSIYLTLQVLVDFFFIEDSFGILL